jgi:hypothetical protein
MPIIYERAFGGAGVMTGETRNQREERNPVGTGFAVAPEHLLNQRAPNVEHPNALISSWNRRPQPAGFGPIARDWQPRLAFAGTYGETWERERMPLLPQDFDERFYLCAPADQQAQGYLHGGEPVELLNLTPGGALRFNLPRVALNFRTAFDTEAVNHRGILHTVIIEPEFPRVIMVWHTMLACHQKVLKLEATTITQKEAPVLVRAGTLPAV